MEEERKRTLVSEFFKVCKNVKEEWKIQMQELGTNKIQAVKYFPLTIKFLKKWNDVKSEIIFWAKSSFDLTLASVLS